MNEPPWRRSGGRRRLLLALVVIPVIAVGLAALPMSDGGASLLWLTLVVSGLYAFGLIAWFTVAAVAGIHVIERATGVLFIAAVLVVFAAHLPWVALFAYIRALSGFGTLLLRR